MQSIPSGYWRNKNSPTHTPNDHHKVKLYCLPERGHFRPESIHLQRQDIGTSLLENLFKEIKSHGIESGMLWCIKANSKACAFYEKHGGKKIDNISPPEEYSIVPHIIYIFRF